MPPLPLSLLLCACRCAAIQGAFLHVVSRRAAGWTARCNRRAARCNRWATPGIMPRPGEGRRGSGGRVCCPLGSSFRLGRLSRRKHTARSRRAYSAAWGRRRTRDSRIQCRCRCWCWCGHMRCCEWFVGLPLGGPPLRTQLLERVAAECIRLRRPARRPARTPAHRRPHFWRRSSEG